MTLTVTVNGTAIDDAIPPSSVQSTQRADDGDTGFGGFLVDDPDALITTTGHHLVTIEESACSQPRLFTGYMTERDTSRSLDRGMIAGDDARAHDATMVDLNAVFNFRVLQGAGVKRPAETTVERLTWLLAHESLAPFIEDTGYVTISAVDMDAADYTGATPATVLQDIVDRGAADAPLTYFAFWDPVAAAASLYLGDESTGIGDSTLAISNDLADINGTTVFAPDAEAKLARTPEEVYSEVVWEYAHGTKRIYRRRASTATAYGIDRGTTVTRPYTGLATTAQAQAERWLTKHSVEKDTISVSIIVPAASAGLAIAGQRIDVKFTHLPGYSAWTSMRIVTSTITPVTDVADLYRIDLVLVLPYPVPDAGCTCEEGDDGVLTTGPIGAQETREVFIGPITVPAYCTMTIDSYEWTEYTTVGGDPPCRIEASWMHIDGVAPNAVYRFLSDSYFADFSNNPHGIRVTPGADLGSTFTSVPTGYGFTLYLPDPVDPNTGSGASGEVIENISDTPFEIWLKCANNPYFASTGDWSITANYHCGPAGDDDTQTDLGPTPGSPVESTADPTVNDDANDGYTVGQTWVNTTSGEVFVLTDSTPGAAVWVNTTSGGCFYDVTEYGATGDGTTDDTTAIEAAITAADATTGGVIFFPPGTYKITTTITLTGQNYHFLGAGSRYGPARIYQATSNTTALSFAPTAPTALRTKTSLVENLVISGPGGASSGRGIDATNDLHVENCFVYGFYDGIYLRSESYYSYIARSTFTDCDRAGLVLDQTNNTTVDTCRFTGLFSGGSAPIGAMQYGIYIGCTFPRGLNTRIVNCSIEYQTRDGIYASGLFGGEISGCYFETQQSSTGYAHVNLGPANAARAVTLEGNYFQGDGTTGFVAIRGGTTDRITVSGNYFGVNSAIGISADGANNSNWLLVNNYNSPAGTFSLPASSGYTLDPSNPPATVGTPALTLGTSNAAGSATSAVRTDATIAVFDATAPATLDFGDAAATGSVAYAARRDHVHGMPAAPAGGELLVADGTTGPEGITPTSYVEEEDAHTTTSASLEDIPDVTTTITLQRTSHVAAWLNTQISGSGVCVIGVAVNFDGTDHDEMQHAISGSDAAALAVVHRTATELPPGTYTVKGRMRRVSGASTPSVDRADLFVMAMGQSGPVILTNEAEDDFVYSD